MAAWNITELENLDIISIQRSKGLTQIGRNKLFDSDAGRPRPWPRAEAEPSLIGKVWHDVAPIVVARRAFVMAGGPTRGTTRHSAGKETQFICRCQYGCLAMTVSIS